LVLARAMADRAAHRGPDGAGVAAFADGRFVDDPEAEAWEVALAHRRLSIIDLSQMAAQPMVYRGRHWLTYNGELYNYLELRTELEQCGHRFKTRSDSEVILAAFAEWGPGCFERMRGMWGLVLVDIQTRTAVLCRDRLGMKPLYLWQSDGLLAVVSEIKQLIEIPGFQARHAEQVVAEYLATGYENQACSFFRDVFPVQPGTYLSFSIDSFVLSAAHPYWWPERIMASVSDLAEASEAFAGKLEECVQIHLRSDVPVGCALSGGLDSSAIAVLASGQGTVGTDFHTFTAGCTGDPAEEREYVDAMLNVIRPAAHFVAPSVQGFLDDLHEFVWHHDEPVSSFSMYASYCVARTVRAANIPVILTGEGGDEVLSGYWQSYFMYLREVGLRGRMITFGSHFAGALLPGGNPALLAQVPVMARRYLDRRRGLAAVSNDSTFVSRVLQDALAVRGQLRRLSEIRTMYLPRLLKWDDRNLMAFSVEGRYPFLDHELVELCLSFKPDVLYHRGWTKWPLRSGFRGRIPERVVRRRTKFGFWVPQTLWLCGSMRPAITKWLSADRPVWDFVNRSAVSRLAERVWDNPRDGDEPGQALVRCFMFDKWLEVFNVA
jgi:asparagine synthase (glutamine-hydrolysing)